MITMQEAAAIVRSRSRRMGATLVTTDLPGSAVSAFTRTVDELVYLIVDTSKADAWLHTREMLLDMSAQGPEERTTLTTVDLPSGRDWTLFRDANVLAFSPQLDEGGRARAITEASELYDVR